MAACAHYDTIIVGQGLAGTTLAWALIEAGQRVLVIDAEEVVTSSKIAGGLITPITGQRLALSWRVEDLMPVARAFYGRIEQRTTTRFFHARTATRLFSNDIEREIWANRRDKPEFQAHLQAEQPPELLDPDVGDASGGGFDMATAQLDVAGYLAASRAHFSYQAMALDWARDVVFDEDSVRAGPYTARRIISCEGYAAARNPFFSGVPFKGAKGNILTVKFDRPFPDKCLHRGIWIAPTGEDRVFRVGATYEWAGLDCIATAGARAEIEAKLQAFIRVPYTVIGQQAAVRPIIRGCKALLGLHPEYPRLGFFNGLASKGSLHAPWFAERFADFLVNGAALPPECDLARHLSHPV